MRRFFILLTAVDFLACRKCAFDSLEAALPPDVRRGSALPLW